MSATGTAEMSNSKVTSTIGSSMRVLNSEENLSSIGEEARRLSENDFELEDEETHKMGQMGAKRIGSLAIGIGVVGIVLNQMSALDIVGNSTGVVDVGGIFDVAGDGLNLLVIGVIIAAAAVLLNLWSGF